MPIAQQIGGTPVRTPELHDVYYSPQDPNGVQYGDGNFAFKWVEISVSAPAGWAFIPGSEAVECLEDNQGSAASNGLPFTAASNKFQIQAFGPNSITARVLVQSRSIVIQLRAKAQYLHGNGGNSL